MSTLVPPSALAFFSRIVVAVAGASGLGLSLQAAEAAASAPERTIEITTAHSALRLRAARDGRLYQLSYGSRRAHPEPAPAPLADNDEYYPAAGNGYFLEPALSAIHADGNLSTELIFVGVETTAADANVALTRVQLRDRHYPFSVTLCFRTYAAEDLIEEWVEFSHHETSAVTLTHFASASPRLRAHAYWVTQFQGEVLREAELSEERLSPGLKVLDSKLTVRADIHRNPSFILSLDTPASETRGEAYGGALAWSGNFQFAFDLDWDNALRVLAGMNPAGAAYRLAPGKTLVTPAMLWTWSAAGKGQVSRNFHHWARRYGIREGAKPRPVLLNNWETTFFDFNEQKLLALLDGGRDLGVDLFLLDDGWFSDKVPTNFERVGLGDWQVNAKMLPHGLGFLTASARERGLGFGIWMEPESVHLGSQLYLHHPDWVLRQPHREAVALNHQVLLDLTRPETKEYVWGAIDHVLAQTRGATYLKWDANRYAPQAGSDYLPRSEQQHLPWEYQWALYEIMGRLADKYPQVMAMLCAGGGGRVDYGALKYFHSFWPSDSTDALQRIYIQWGYSHVFPSWAMSSHITSMGQRPAKFAVDVALTGALGVDRDVAKMTLGDRAMIKAGIKLYKDSLRQLVAEGDLYRLESPYEGKRAALDYVLPDRSRGVLFVYQLGEAAFGPVRPQGLDPAGRYRVREINLVPGTTSRLALHDQVVSGETLMADGLASPLQRALDSAVIEFDRQP